MRIGDRFILGLLVGVLLGIILGVSIVRIADERVCPSNPCIDSASVIAISDQGFFPIVHREFQQARKSIHIVAFELKYYESYPGSKENILVEDLVEAHQRGVDVRIIVDEYSDRNNAYQYLKERGIRIIYDPKDVTTHAKLIIVDGKTIILGSTNFSYYGLEKNREADLLVRAKHIAEYFENYFEEMWQ